MSQKNKTRALRTSRSRLMDASARKQDDPGSSWLMGIAVGNRVIP